jgi:hypothetical protein
MRGGGIIGFTCIVLGAGLAHGQDLRVQDSHAQDSRPVVAQNAVAVPLPSGCGIGVNRGPQDGCVMAAPQPHVLPSQPVMMPAENVKPKPAKPDVKPKLDEAADTLSCERAAAAKAEADRSASAFSAAALAARWAPPAPTAERHVAARR